jgi:hypothetical protein
MNIHDHLVIRNARTCRCDTKSHVSSELTDWRAYERRLVPGECSTPVPAPGMRRGLSASWGVKPGRKPKRR